MRKSERCRNEWSKVPPPQAADAATSAAAANTFSHTSSLAATPQHPLDAQEKGPQSYDVHNILGFWTRYHPYHSPILVTYQYRDFKSNQD